MKNKMILCLALQNLPTSYSDRASVFRGAYKEAERISDKGLLLKTAKDLIAFETINQNLFNENSAGVLYKRDLRKFISYCIIRGS